MNSLAGTRAAFRCLRSHTRHIRTTQRRHRSTQASTAAQQAIRSGFMKLIDAGGEVTLDSTISQPSIAVMDTSCNPPTLCHEAMLLRAFDKVGARAGVILVSSSNADKASAAGHGSALAKRLGLAHAAAASVMRQDTSRKVACAATDTPLFVDKAKMLRRALRPGQEAMFLLGADTVRRLLDPCYYVARSGNSTGYRGRSLVGASSLAHGGSCGCQAGALHARSREDVVSGSTAAASPAGSLHHGLGGGAALKEAIEERDLALEEMLFGGGLGQGGSAAPSDGSAPDAADDGGPVASAAAAAGVRIRLVCFERPTGPNVDGVTSDHLDQLLGGAGMPSPADDAATASDGMQMHAPLPARLAGQVTRLRQLFLREDAGASMLREGSQRNAAVPPWQDLPWLQRVWLGLEPGRGLSSTQARMDIAAWTRRSAGQRDNRADKAEAEGGGAVALYPGEHEGHASPCLSPEVDEAARLSGLYAEAHPLGHRMADSGDQAERFDWRSVGWAALGVCASAVLLYLWRGTGESRGQGSIQCQEDSRQQHQQSPNTEYSHEKRSPSPSPSPSSSTAWYSAHRRMHRGREEGGPFAGYLDEAQRVLASPVPQARLDQLGAVVGRWAAGPRCGPASDRSTKDTVRLWEWPRPDSDRLIAGSIPCSHPALVEGELPSLLNGIDLRVIDCRSAASMAQTAGVTRSSSAVPASRNDVDQLNPALLVGLLRAHEANELRKWLMAAMRKCSKEPSTGPRETAEGGPPGWGFHTQGRRQLAFESPQLSAELWRRVAAQSGSGLLPRRVWMGGRRWKVAGLGTGWRAVWYGQGARHTWHCDEAVIGGGPNPCRFVQSQADRGPSSVGDGNNRGRGSGDTHVMVVRSTEGGLRHVSCCTFMLYLTAPACDASGEQDSTISTAFSGGQLVWLQPGSPVPQPASETPDCAARQQPQRKRHALGVLPRLGDAALVTYDTPHASLPQAPASPGRSGRPGPVGAGLEGELSGESNSSCQLAGKVILRGDVWLEREEDEADEEDGRGSIEACSRAVELYHKARQYRASGRWQDADTMFAEALGRSEASQAEMGAVKCNWLRVFREQPSYERTQIKTSG